MDQFFCFFTAGSCSNDQVYRGRLRSNGAEVAVKAGGVRQGETVKPGSLYVLKNSSVRSSDLGSRPDLCWVGPIWQFLSWKFDTQTWSKFQRWSQEQKRCMRHLLHFRSTHFEVTPIHCQKKSEVSEVYIQFPEKKFHFWT